VRSDAHTDHRRTGSPGAPKLEPALFTQAATLIAKTAEDGGFHGPSIDEFFPDVLFSVLVSPSRGST
jgi:hypothetical protein